MFEYPRPCKSFNLALHYNLQSVSTYSNSTVIPRYPLWSLFFAFQYPIERQSYGLIHPQRDATTVAKHQGWQSPRSARRWLPQIQFATSWSSQQEYKRDPHTLQRHFFTRRWTQLAPPIFTCWPEGEPCTKHISNELIDNRKMYQRYFCPPMVYKAGLQLRWRSIIEWSLGTESQLLT